MVPGGSLKCSSAGSIDCKVMWKCDDNKVKYCYLILLFFANQFFKKINFKFNELILANEFFKTYFFPPKVWLGHYNLTHCVCVLSLKPKINSNIIFMFENSGFPAFKVKEKKINPQNKENK